MPSTLLLVSSSLAFAAILYVRYIQQRKNDKYFPSPPSEPIFGHLRAFPQNYPWLTFTEWKKQYGDIVQLFVLGKSIIILNDAEDSHELLDKRGANYSDRPYPVLQGQIGGFEYFTTFVRYGDDFRVLRRFTTQYLNSRDHVHLYPLLGEQAKILLKNLLENPGNFVHHIEKLSAGTVVKATYGPEVLTKNDNYINSAADAVNENAALGMPGLTFVDLFPIARYVPLWIPGAGFLKLKRARKTRIKMDRMIDEPFDSVRLRRMAGINGSSFVDNALDEYERCGVKSSHKELLIKNAAATIHAAGAETSADTILTFVLMMIRHPEIAVKAQAEIDRVIGDDQLPELKDRPDIPYVDCILKEVLRINPAVPLGIAHASIEKDYYKGKVIPAGSVVVFNLWAMLHDERYFPCADVFNPDRYISKEQASRNKNVHQLNTFKPDDPSNLTFGFGRRICPGRFLGDANLWLVFANLLAVFDILPAVDPVTCKEVIPELDWIGGLTSRLKPFNARFIPRSWKHALLAKGESINELVWSPPLSSS